MESNEIKKSLIFDDAQIRKADAAYKSFPSFEEWSKCVVNTERWEKYSTFLKKKDEISPEQLQRAQEVVKRAAAIDTGAIEGLYEVDRGFTFTVATEAAMWESLLAAKGENVESLFHSQLHAYDFVLDFATKRMPLAEAWIRTLHAEICKSQEVYLVYTSVGPQQQPLPKGKYKVNPNHVMRPDREIFSYAPVDLTPAEMHRLCTILESEEFTQAHPIMQAAYAHYAFVAIHPFADGNGRVARALASIFTYRAYSIPLLILYDDREEYYESLEAADKGEIQKFINFILERAIDSLRMIEESLKASETPDPFYVTEKIQKLFKTKGGYTHQQVDIAGHNFLKLLKKEMDSKAVLLNNDQVTIQIGLIRSEFSPIPQEYRLKRDGDTNIIVVYCRTTYPADADISSQFGVIVPKNSDKDDEIIIKKLNSQSEETIRARIGEIFPHIASAVQMRVRINVQTIFGEMMTELLQKAEASLKKKGY